MGRFRKDRTSPDSGQANSEPSKNFRKLPLPSEAADSPLYQLKSNKQSSDANLLSDIVNVNNFQFQEAIASHVAGSDKYNPATKAAFESYKFNNLYNEMYQTQPVPYPDETYAEELMATPHFDPFKLNPIAQRKYQALKDRTGAGFALRNLNLDSVLDPLSKALHQDTQEFVSALTEYLYPYQAAFSIEENPYVSPEHRRGFLLKVGRPIGGAIQQIASKKISFESAYQLNSINDVYYMFDGMISAYEKASGISTKRKVVDQIQNRVDRGEKYPALFMTLAEKTYFEKYMEIDQNTGLLKMQPLAENSLANWESELLKEPPKPKERKLILCPDHGNPMMRKKGDEGHLHCTVIGCTRTLKRKVPREDIPDPPQVPEDSERPAGDLGEPKEEAPVIAPGWKMVPEDFDPAGFSPADPYSENSSTVRVHQEGFLYYLVQRQPNGTDMRICLGLHMQNVTTDTNSVNVSSFNSNTQQVIQGVLDVRMQLGGLIPE
jgi:hypothetical protein